MFSSLLLRNSARGADKNLCFTNAALQILRNVPSFKENCIAHLEFSPAHRHITDILNYEGTEKTVSAHYAISKKYGFPPIKLAPV